MKEATEMLNSKAAMQIRFLELIGKVGNQPLTKIVIMWVLGFINNENGKKIYCFLN